MGGCGAYQSPRCTDLVLAGDPPRLDLLGFKSPPPFLVELEGAGRRREPDVEAEGRRCIQPPWYFRPYTTPQTGSRP